METGTSKESLRWLPRLPVDARLYLDANQAWTSDQAVGVIHALNKRGISIDLLEQPVPAGDIAGLARVCLALDTPVMADEKCLL